MSTPEGKLSQTISNTLFDMAMMQTHPSGDIYSDQKFLNDSSKNLREIYTKIFDHQDKYCSNDPLWWMRIFRQTGDQMLENMKKDHQITAIPFNSDWEIVLKYGSKIFRANKDKRLLTIGRRHECDINFDQKFQDTSRLHALVYFLPEFNLTAVVDVGSLCGIETLERSSGLSCESSAPDMRKIIMLQHGEFAKLKFCSEQIIFSPKLCIVCYENARDHMFGCSHYVVCKACSEKLLSCPICRTEITIRQQSLDFNQTNPMGQ